MIFARSPPDTPRLPRCPLLSIRPKEISWLLSRSGSQRQRGAFNEDGDPRIGSGPGTKEGERTTADRWLAVAKGIIRAAPYCFLVTLTSSGQANARLMQPFSPEKDLTIWFGSSPRTRKVREIADDRRVTLAYEDPEEKAYVTLLGAARVETELRARREHWRESPLWRAIWPQGSEGDDCVLIEFVPSRIEVMSGARNVLPEPYGLRPGVLVRQGDSWVFEYDLSF